MAVPHTFADESGGIKRQYLDDNFAAVSYRVSAAAFGAKGDNVADDWAALQAAINFVQLHTRPDLYNSATPSLGSIELFIPAGYYYVSQPLVIRYPIAIRGDGCAEFSRGTRITQAFVGDLFSVNPISTGISVSFTDLTLISGFGGAGGAQVNLLQNGTAAANSNRFVRVVFGQPQNLAVLVRGDDTVFDTCVFDVSITGSTNSVQLGTSTVGEIASNVRFINCNWFNILGRCVTGVRYRDIVFSNCIVSQPSSAFQTAYFFDGLATNQGDAVSISGNFENVSNILSVNSSCRNFKLANVTGFNALSSAAHWILNNGAFDLSIFATRCRGFFNTGTYTIYAEGAACSGVSINGCSFENSGGTSANALAFNPLSISALNKVRNNLMINWPAQSVSETRASTGLLYAPGTVGASGSVTINRTIAGAKIGDSVEVFPVLGASFFPVGITVNCFVSAADTVSIRYSNNTATGVVVAAHDLVLECYR